MHVDTESVGLIISPLPIVDITVNMCELPLSVCVIFPPLSSVLGTVRPVLITLAVAEPSFPLTVINSVAFKGVGWSHLAALIRIERLLRGNSLLALLIGEVLATAHVFASQEADVLPCLVASEGCLDLNDALCVLFKECLHVRVIHFASVSSRSFSVVSASAAHPNCIMNSNSYRLESSLTLKDLSSSTTCCSLPLFLISYIANERVKYDRVCVY